MIHTSLKEILHYNIITKQGELAKIHNFYFTSDPWVVRYIMVNTGGWRKRELFLVPVVFVMEIDKQKKEISIDATLDKIKQNPVMDDNKPVTRKTEIDVLNFYELRNYWEGDYIWGASPFPHDLKKVITGNTSTEHPHSNTSFLESIKTILTFKAKTDSGETGYIKDMIINKLMWKIEYFVLNTHHFFPGKLIVAGTKWIKRINWFDQTIIFDSYKKIFEKTIGNTVLFTNN